MSKDLKWFKERLDRLKKLEDEYDRQVSKNLDRNFDQEPPQQEKVNK